MKVIKHYVFTMRDIEKKTIIIFGLKTRVFFIMKFNIMFIIKGLYIFITLQKVVSYVNANQL